jgi:hypothetical protein
MASKKPLVLDALGNRQQLQAGDSISSNVVGSMNCHIPDANVTGTSDVIILTPTLPLPAYSEGVEYTFGINVTNLTNSPTVNISGLGNIPMKMGSVAVPIGGLVINNDYRIRIEGSGTGGTAPWYCRIAPIDTVSSNGDTINGPLTVSGGINNCNIAGGTVDALILAPNAGLINSYQVGAEFLFIASGANTIVAPTISISGLASLPTTMGSVILPIGGLITNNWYRAIVDINGTSFRITPYDAVSSNGDTVNGPLIINGTLNLLSTSGAGILNNSSYGWRDLTGILNPFGTNGINPTNAIFIGSYSDYAHATGKGGDLCFHIPHDYAPGTDIFAHVHWSHNGTACNGTFAVSLASTYAKGYAQAAFSAQKTVTLSAAVTTANTPQYEHRIDETQISIAGGSSTMLNTALLEPDGLVLLHYLVTSIPTISGGGTNGNTSPFIFEIDLHYQSTNITTKNKNFPFYA